MSNTRRNAARPGRLREDLVGEGGAELHRAHGDQQRHLGRDRLERERAPERRVEVVELRSVRRGRAHRRPARSSGRSQWTPRAVARYGDDSARACSSPSSGSPRSWRPPPPAPAPRARRAPGGAVDPYFPRQGNGGYNVAALRPRTSATRPATQHLTGDGHDHGAARRRRCRASTSTCAATCTCRSVLGRTGSARASRSRRPLVQELVITPARTRCAKGQPFTVEVALRRHRHARHRPGRLARRLHPDRRRRVRGQRAAGLADLVPGQRHPARQGDVRGVDHRAQGRSSPCRTARCAASATSGARTTWSWTLRPPVSSYLVTATIGQFDVTTRHARPAACPTSSPSTRPRREGRAGAARAAGDRRLLQHDVRPLPVRPGRRDRRQRARTSATRSRRRPGRCSTARRTIADPVARARAPVVRRRRDAASAGATSGSTRASPSSRPGCGTSTPAATTAAQHLQDLLAQPASDTDGVDAAAGQPRVGRGRSSPTRSTTAAPARCEALRADGRRPHVLHDPAGLAGAAHRYGNATVAQFTAYAAAGRAPRPDAVLPRLALQARASRRPERSVHSVGRACRVAVPAPGAAAAAGQQADPVRRRRAERAAPRTGTPSPSTGR